MNFAKPDPASEEDLELYNVWTNYQSVDEFASLSYDQKKPNETFEESVEAYVECCVEDQNEPLKNETEEIKIVNAILKVVRDELPTCDDISENLADWIR